MSCPRSQPSMKRIDREEVKMAQETRKIQSRRLLVMATCVRVLVLHVHRRSATSRPSAPLPSRPEALRCAPEYGLMTRRGENTHPLDAEGQTWSWSAASVVIRPPHGPAMWVVADNLRMEPRPTPSRSPKPFLKWMGRPERSASMR